MVKNKKKRWVQTFVHRSIFTGKVKGVYPGGWKK